MAKPTREQGISFIRVRLMLMSKAPSRNDLTKMASTARSDLQLMVALFLITQEERIQYECEINRTVQQRLCELMPLRLVGGTA